MERIQITVKPAHGQTDLTVADAMHQVLDAMRVFDDARRASDSENELTWRLEKATANSPFTVTALATASSPELAIQLARAVKREASEGLRNLARDGVPAFWMGQDTVNAAHALLRRTKNGIGETSIEFFPNEVLVINRAFADQALDRIASIEVEVFSPSRAYGEVEGRLLSVATYRGQPALQLLSPVYGVFWCKVPQHLIDEFGGEHRMKEVWERKNIGASGRIAYDPSGKIRIMDAEELRVIHNAPEVDLDSLLDPDFTSGLDPVEYLRRLHEGELAS
jgi:hypothetical protein